MIVMMFLYESRAIFSSSKAFTRLPRRGICKAYDWVAFANIMTKLCGGGD